jgi:hypothetical protein
MEATHEITACYFPKTGEVEATWEDLTTGERAGATFKVNKKTGEAIARTVMACVYQHATIKQADAMIAQSKKGEDEDEDA